MGDSKLCLLLVLSTTALAVAQDEDQPTCLLAKMYKTLHKYEYQYEAESLNAINGASPLKNGPKATCKVEIEVPQTCSFIVRTTGCSLREVVAMDSDGNPGFGASPSSNAFAAEMERYPLKVVIEGASDVKLYPEEGETTTILNIKRGIISALAVPLIEEDKENNVPSIHGMCRTYYTVNAKQDIATDISLERDLSTCDKFVPVRDHTSPLALISGLHYPLAQLVRSSQNCNYKFDNDKKHMTSGSCTEKHILIPFSHKGEYGVTNIGKQELTLVQVSTHNDRVFDHGDNAKCLHMDTVEHKTFVQNKDFYLDLLRQLATLPETDGEKRAHLFHQIVTMVRGMKKETLSTAIPESLEVSRVLTYQVLSQCGTPECSSAIMQILRGFETTLLEVDATVFALGLVSNPSALLINDMLQMAKYKPSKPIMYALSNVVKRFYKTEGKLIPEIHSVAEFMAAHLGDCSGDNAFLTLRVIGNMAPAVVPASPALRASVLLCVNQPDASLAVQQAAIQVYRLTAIPDEGRNVLTQVLLDNTSPVQKRIAAYLVLMKNPLPSELVRLVTALPIEENTQFKSFVVSHIVNILSSNEPETRELRQKIRDAVQDNEIGPIMDPIKFSRNYRIGSVEGNMIFEGTSYLPKEVMLEMTLKAFGFDIDMMEVGMEGKGFEPTVDALFGENGFFPDTALKTMYFVSNNMPLRVREIVQSFIPSLRNAEMKKLVTQNLMKEVGLNLKRLMEKLKTSNSPDAMVYLRLLGNELGYLKSNEMEEMAYGAAMVIDSMFKMFPRDLLMGLMTKADNTIFAHYIFMDNEFFLPTVTGVPLKITLSGTFTPGVKAGIKIARDMSEVAFMPSAGIEFATHIGAYIPEYVNSGLEMHSNIFHESGLQAKISMGRDNVKLTIPAPRSPTKLIKMTNNLVAVSGLKVMTLPTMVSNKIDVSRCTPFFAGMKYCTALEYMDAFSEETTPYFPFTGDSKFSLELHPSGEVTEYTATLAYELLQEGEEGKHKVDALKFILRAEGTKPTEARAVIKFNRRKNMITADVQIPDYDVEAGLRLGIVDGNTKGKGTHSISLDLINKNIPQLSLIGRANLEAMKKGMLQIQLLVPLLNIDASVTANMKRDKELELKLKSDMKVITASSKQELTMKYDASKVAVEFKSDANADATILPISDIVEKYTYELLNTQVGQTDMKVSHIFKKFGEAANNYMEKYGDDLPYLQNFRVPDMPEISLPETLFLNTETKAVYYFNKERFTITIPLPLGGKSTVDLNFPPALTTPHLSLPEAGLEIVSREIPIPELFVPESLTFTVPLFGKAEVSTVMRSNLYDMEASMTAGKDVVEAPSYSAMFAVKGSSPFEILSVKIEGSGMLATTDSLKAQIKGALSHKFIEASVNFVEDTTITDKINVKSSSKIVATSPFGLNVDIDHNSLAGINTETILINSKFDGKIKAGPFRGQTVSAQSMNILPFRREAKIDSLVNFDSNIAQAENTFEATFAKGRLLVVSNTNAFEDTLKHSAELSFIDSELSLKCHSSALAFGMNIGNKAEASAGAGKFVLRIETNGDHSENRVYSLMTSSLDVNGLTVDSDATIKLLENEAKHKLTLRLDKDGLTTAGKNTLQSPLSLENAFSFGLDTSKASLSITNKASLFDLMFSNGNDLLVTLSGLQFNSKAQAQANQFASYGHDITTDLSLYAASAVVNNDLKLLTTNLNNNVHLQADLSKIYLTGILKATCDEEEIKHVYQVNYADMTANIKCSTTGKLFGTRMSHNSELEIIGLAARFTNDARFNSQFLRFDHSLHSSIVPFDFNLDALFNADGDMVLYGEHSAQMYGKFLLRVQPLAFASSHECRASVTQKLENGFSLGTTFDNKMDTVLSLDEQKTSFSLKSKMNEHAFNHDMSVYNTIERTGMEISSIILTNIINTESTENQEFAVSGSLKYDKNTNCHLINFPLLENVPLFLEGIKDAVVRIAEIVQDYISNEEIRAQLEALPQHVGEFVTQLNIEGQVIQMKEFLRDFTPNHLISMEDVKAAFGNLKMIFRELTSDAALNIQHYAAIVKEIILNSNLSETMLSNIQDLVIAINDEYDIKGTVVYIINTMKRMIQQIDLEQLKGTSMAFLHNIDSQYEIGINLQYCLDEMKSFSENFDIVHFVAELKKYIASLHINAFMKDLVSDIPMAIFSEMTECIRKLIQNLDILGKINTFSAKLREIIVTLEADKKVQVILEKLVEVIKQFRMEETFSAMAKMVRDADIPTKFQQAFQNVIDYLKSTEVKEIIQQLQAYIEYMVQELKSLNYNKFVDYGNDIVAARTVYINDLIQALEIPQKLEAVKYFFNVVYTSAKDIINGLREIKAGQMITYVKELMDQAVFGDINRFIKYIKEEVTKIDIRSEITSYLKLVRSVYNKALTFVSDKCTLVIDNIRTVIPEQKIISEIQQIFDALIAELKKCELNTPSFTIPLTDLVVQSMTFSLDKRRPVDIPTQLDIPEFTILGLHTVKATTISFDDIKQRIIQVIDFILNFNIQILDIDTFFGDLRMKYIPSMPEINFQEITLPTFSFPTIPQFPLEKIVESLKVPEMQLQLPAISSNIIVPCFGKLYGEFRFNTPIYTVKTSAEFQNTTTTALTPEFTGIITSQATSPSFEILNYKVDSSAQIALPKMSRIVLAESVKVNHLALAVEHQASLSLYGLSAQAQAKTAVKVNSPIYTADVMSIAFIAMEEGMSASLDTTYNHLVDLPIIGVRSDATMNQKAIVRQDGYALTLTVNNNGKSVAEEGNHKSTFYLSFSPSAVTLTFSGDTDSKSLTMKQQVTAEVSPMIYGFNFQNEMKTQIIKNSRISTSGSINLNKMKVELKANHDTELTGSVRGAISNGINIAVIPFQLITDFQNTVSCRVKIFGAPTAKIGLQNHYSATLTPNNQRMNTIYIAHLNKWAMTSNFTIDNNKNEAGVFTAMEGNANLEFLNKPISIPAFEIPFADFRTPAITDVNLYELIGLKHLFITTDQNVGIQVDNKIVYQKKQAAPIAVIMGLIQIPPAGDLITELSFKSAVINVNVNTGLYASDDLVFRLGATTSSVFESLKAKLDGTTSLTTKRGIKLANSLSLENRHIEGTHDSTITVNTNTLETAASAASIGRISLPILSLELNQKLVADTKAKAKVHVSLNVNGDFNIPVIEAVGKANSEYSLKLEGTREVVSIEAFTKANMNGTVLDGYLVLGVLDSDANLFLNNGLRSTSKVIADVKLNHGTTKVIKFDLIDSLDLQASLSRVSAVLKHASNNELNLFTFSTNGKHTGQATIDLAPISSLTADIEMNLSQPSSLGDFTIVDKTVAEVTIAKQKIFTKGRFVSPLYISNLEVQLEGNAPVFKSTLKSSATSTFVILDYDMDASSTLSFENADLNMINKLVLTHADLNMDVNHVIDQAMSVYRQTLNVDITSQTFTNINLRYAARRDGLSASVSAPSTGFLGLQFNGRIPSQMSARVYGRYPSAPEVDIDILVIKSSSKSANSLQIVYNRETPKLMLSELRKKLPSIVFAFTEFANKHQITGSMEQLKNVVVNHIGDVYNTAISYDVQMSQLSVLFRNSVVQYQKTIQIALDAIIRILRETKFKLPGSEEMTTIPQVLKKVTSSIAAMLDRTLQIVYENMAVYYNIFVEKIGSVKVSMPVGDAVTVAQVVETLKIYVKGILGGLVYCVENMDSLDTMLVKIGKTLKALVDKSQEFIDSIGSDYLDEIVIHINNIYRDLVSLTKNFVDRIATFDMEQLYNVYDYIMDVLIYVVDQVNITIFECLQQSLQGPQSRVKVTRERLEIDLPFSFQL
ncbi:apolipoprotein Bb, tandem duplicate 1 [Dunckerocampus dactyliophorus]|uniref:apolipoprotein Bb, tandem duplicate 1 n=1 Tax=Dunckerocampus dactyliophorus TaxID=161453 RepID=UPI00240718EE|nr:apolipoprotein Bb, tandem duplicate 1 [Dunckerocampus dactyliophorus]